MALSNQQIPKGQNSPSLSQLGNYSPIGSVQSALGQKASSPNYNVPKTPLVLAPKFLDNKTNSTSKGQFSTTTPGIGGDYTPSVVNNSAQVNNSTAQNQLSGAQTQLADLQKQQEALNKYGLKDTNQLTKDASGNYIATPPTPPTGGGITTGTPNAPYSLTTPEGTPNAGLYGQLTTGLANVPLTNTDTALARKNLQELQNEYAQATNDIESRPQGLSQQAGQEGILNRLFASKQGAAQTALSSALTSQQLQQQALGTAASLAAPQSYGITNAPYNPVTGQFGNMAGASGNGGLSSVGQTLGQLDMAQQLPQLNASYQQATGVKDSFESWIKNNKSVLPSDVNLVNKLRSWALGGQFSDPAYPELNQFLNEYLNTITPLIGSSGNVTNFKQAIVQDMINPSSGADSVVQQINNLHSIAGGKLLEYNNAINNQFNPQSVQTNDTNGGNTFGSFNYKPQ
jgi:hypothetical protein